jgi:YceI-like domain
MTTAVQPFTGTYELDPNHSTFQFAVRHMKVSTFRASFADTDARLNRRRRRDRARRTGALPSPCRSPSRLSSGTTSSEARTSSTQTSTPAHVSLDARRAQRRRTRARDW